MIATVHMLAGAAAGVSRKNLLYALVAGIISHYLLDMVPHLDAINAIHAWNKAAWTIIVIDIILGAIIGLALWIKRYQFPSLSPFVFGAFGGLLPDILDSQPFWAQYIVKIPVLGHIQMFHYAANGLPVQYFPMPQWAVLGILTQVVVAVIAFRILLREKQS